MKKILAALAFLVALPAFGQATVSLDFNAPQAAKFTRAMTRTNTATCTYYGLPAACTMGQARQEFCRRAGVGGVTTCTDPLNPATCTTTPLTPTCNGNTQVIIYTDLTTFVKRETLRLITEQYDAQDKQDDAVAAKAAFDAKTQAQRDAVCTSLGLAAGCTPFN